tara:strand:- start:1294 stop:1677 length:384 start_codon:yes stop_codon:yes gene_type:complete
MAIELINPNSKKEYVSTSEKRLKNPSKWYVSPLKSRTLFAILQKHNTTQATGNSMLPLAMDFAKFGLKKVTGPCSDGFHLVDDSSLGFKEKAVSDDYLDTLPMNVLIEVGGWVGEVSNLSSTDKKKS